MSSPIRQIIPPRAKDLGGFQVRRILPYSKQRMVGPWVFFDHMGPADFEAGQGINVRPHPHINLATVTYLFEGEILHRDSVGSEQAIRPGDINLMVAGKGIVHSERERDEIKNIAHKQHGLQLWHALPEEAEEVEPSFHHYPSAEIPALDVDGVSVRVMMGSAYGVSSPVRTFVETLYIEAKLSAGQTLILPQAKERALYCVEGSLKIGDETIEPYHMAILQEGAEVEITSEAGAQIALVGGDPLGERFIEWNFVSSRKERIEEAKQAWRNREMPTVPGDEEEWIPLPEDAA